MATNGQTKPNAFFELVRQMAIRKGASHFSPWFAIMPSDFVSSWHQRLAVSA
jgi:hypothetical protein